MHKKSLRRLWIGLGLLVVLTVVGVSAVYFVPETPTATHQVPIAELRVPVTDAAGDVETSVPEDALADAVTSPESPPETPYQRYEEPLPPPEPMAVVNPALPPTEIRGVPKIAIVIDDMGLALRNSQRAVNLPTAVTLAYLPYATNVQQQVDTARAKGHEIMLHLPMEPMGQDNPGPNALLVNLSADELLARLEKSLNAFSGYTGINNHMGSKFTSDPTALRSVMSVIKQRDVFFLDSRTSGKSAAEQIAREIGIPAIGRDVFLDDTISTESIRQQLHQTENIARRKGYAIAIGHPHPATLAVLEEWLPAVQKAGFKIVPISVLLADVTR